MIFSKRAKIVLQEHEIDKFSVHRLQICYWINETIFTFVTIHFLNYSEIYVIRFKIRY